MDAGPSYFQPIVEDLASSSPDFVFSTVVGNATKHFYEAYREAGLSAEAMPIASLTTTEAELAIMRPEARAGHFTSAPFFASLLLDPRRSRWSHLLQQAGVPLNQCWESAYSQVLLFAESLASVGSDDPTRIVQDLRGREFDAPQGTIRIDPDNNHTWVIPRIGRSKSDGSFEIIRESRGGVRPDPYLVSYAISSS